MDENAAADTLDQVVDDTVGLLPDVEVTGLPITGRVLRLARHLEARREEVLGTYGLSVADFDVLTTMLRRAGDGALKVRDLQRSMMLSSGGTTKRLDRLEDAGLLERHSDPDDRRGVLVMLSPDGRELVSQALRAITIAENDTVGDAIRSETERVQFADGLRRLLIAQEAIGDEVRMDPDDADRHPNG